MEIKNVEIVLNIFTIDKGEVKILLNRKKDEPYKGYWLLPYSNLLEEKNITDIITDILNNICGLPMIVVDQFYSFSDFEKKEGKHIVNIGYLGLVDSTTVEIKEEVVENIEKNWFSIKEIPKMAYNHDEIINKATQQLRNKLVNINILKNFFPSDFTLPELQKVYELILDKMLDRRNFRKKFLTFGLIEDSGEKNEGGNGRPAKLYRFKENIKDINLF